MPQSDTEQLDFLWKKVIFGARRSAENETTASLLICTDDEETIELNILNILDHYG